MQDKPHFIMVIRDIHAEASSSDRRLRIGLKRMLRHYGFQIMRIEPIDEQRARARELELIDMILA